MLILVLALMLTTCPEVSSKEALLRAGVNRHDPFRSVPRKDRESLRLAVEKMVGFLKDGNWKEAYQIYLDRDDYTEEAFVKEMESLNRLEEFSTIKVTYNPTIDQWVIAGCAVFHSPSPGERKGVVSSLYAKHTVNGWRLSGVSILLFENFKGGFCPCTSMRSK